jgi:hypothetical protein
MGARARAHVLERLSPPAIARLVLERLLDR